MTTQAKASIRWSTDGQYHVVGIEVQGGNEQLAWLPHCRALPKLQRLRLLGASEGTADFVQRELRDTPVRIEYWVGSWTTVKIPEIEKWRTEK